MGEFLAGNWWWAVPLGVGGVAVAGYIMLMVVGLVDWMNRGSH